MILFLTLLATSWSSPTQPDYTVDIAAGARKQVAFLAIGNPGILKIQGKVAETQDPNSLSGTFHFQKEKLQGSAKLKIESLDTGIGLRNRHMKEKYLEVAKFPDAEFTLQPLALPESFWAQAEAQANLPFAAQLLVHGERKPVSGKVQLQRKGQAVEMAFEFQLKLQDFAIAVPSFMGVTVADEVKVSVDYAGTLQPRS